MALQRLPARSATTAQPRTSSGLAQRRLATSRGRVSLAARVLNVASGSRPGAPQQPPQAPSSPPSGARRVTSPSLPSILAGVGGTVLLGAAALHAGDPHSAGLVGHGLAAAREFGPGDLLQHSFGPSRTLWEMMLHSPQATANAAASAAHHASHNALVQPSPQALLHLTAPPAGAEGEEGGLVAQARSVADGAVAAVKGAAGEVCDGYNRWLEESPLMCKIVTGNFFTIAGDMLAQLGTGGGGHGDTGDASATAASAGGRKKVDFMRTARLCIETSALGTPLGHWWFGLLDSSIMPDDPHCPAAVMSKMLLDQVCFAPAGLAMFFVAIKLLEGKPGDIGPTLKKSYVKALLGGYLLWPVAGVLNFALLPNEYRLLFNNCVNIVWTCFLSIMSSGDADSSETGETASPASAPSAASSHVAQELAAAAVVAAAAIAAAGDRPSFGYVAGLAVALVEAAGLSLPPGDGAALPPQSPPPSPLFAPGATACFNGVCVELCSQPPEALH
ncbi:hypothetical protein HYH03_016831 [Edaphochlamys debaryana]|uniref:Uncharacterized protein n=1 Tax=Edaphochlamys debaryana TaxID=47281 RepID=A0A835XJQ1_9CHLO|nr:hypothetical protein HYH03_016831 [Edaphochlamys debaryana]|eukprot:KAG2484417.1 hypothetical protein HYH03_016831 [Edaphochlamys debaryana]